MARPLADRVALVTGASRGIGAATALALASSGAHVILTARTEAGLVEIEEKIHREGGTATIAPLDLTDGAHVDRLAQAIAQRWQRLDILIANAGILGPLSPLGHITPADWDRVLAVNLTANWRLVRNFDALLRAAPAGRLIALSSGAARRPRAYWGPYAASKAALETMMQCYAEEVGAITAIRIALLDPAGTRTSMRRDAYPGEDPETLKPPSVVAEAIARMLIDDFDNGTYVRLEGPAR